MQGNLEREPIQRRSIRSRPIDLLRKPSRVYKPRCKRCRTGRLLDHPDEAFGQYYYATLIRFDPDIQRLVKSDTDDIIFKYLRYKTLDSYLGRTSPLPEEDEDEEEEQEGEELTFWDQEESEWESEWESEEEGAESEESLDIDEDMDLEEYLDEYLEEYLDEDLDEEDLDEEYMFEQEMYEEDLDEEDIALMSRHRRVREMFNSLVD